MAVYETGYQRYSGPLSARWSRFLVPARYAMERLLASKMVIILLVTAGLLVLGAAVLIYLRYNAPAIEGLGIKPQDLIVVDAKFFNMFLSIQLGIGFLLLLIAGPSLLSMDLAFGALPLYFSRPFGRHEYLLGKFTVIAVLLSAISWLPTWLLFGLEGSYQGLEWTIDNLRIPIATFLGAWVNIIGFTLMTFALAAWVRWPLAVRGGMIGLIIVTEVLGEQLADLMNSSWGRIGAYGSILEGAQSHLFGVAGTAEVPVLGTILSMGVFFTAFFWIIHRKLRAFEVVG